MIKRNITLLLLLTVFFSLSGTSSVLAGNGDGSGGGKNNPLSLVSSTPANGDQDFDSSSPIQLTFSKNVVNLAVQENNKKCFSLVDSNGAAIPIEVTMPDDQIDPEHKTNITLKPLDELKPNTSYKLQISADLQAKNGTKLGQPITISFTTAANSEVNSEVNSASNSSNTSSAGKDKTNRPQANNNSSYAVYIVSFIILLAVIAVMITLRRRKK